jgi:gas vesicle protein
MGNGIHSCNSSCILGVSLEIKASRKNGGSKNMPNQNNDSVNTFAAFACGGILGAGIALLLAPQSGKDTRESLSLMGEKAQKRSKRFASDVAAKMDHIFKDIQYNLKSRMGDGKSWTEGKVAEIEQILQTGQKQIQKEIEQILNS